MTRAAGSTEESRSSHDSSAEADELLLVCGVVAEDETARFDDGCVTLGVAPAGPQLDVQREIANDRAQRPPRRGSLPRSSSSRSRAPVRSLV